MTVYQHDGSYEYIQFLALEDIDFGTTPYSVICARNDQSSPVNPDGWAQGGDVTYKFELTEGYAAKGTFFYVGGNAMRISGFNKSCSYFSTRIDHANWIRVKNYPTEAGDGGIGNMTGNNDLLHDPNVPSVGKNVADGVAIFAGLAVDRNTIPADAVFYGSVLDKYAYDADTGSGYQVPDNEFYSRVHPETGTPQPYFGQGTNTFMFDDVAYDYDASEFLMLGGVFDTGKVYAARGATYKRIPTCPGDADVSDIETGEGVSYILSSGL